MIKKYEFINWNQGAPSTLNFSSSKTVVLKKGDTIDLTDEEVQCYPGWFKAIISSTPLKKEEPKKEEAPELKKEELKKEEAPELKKEELKKEEASELKKEELKKEEPGFFDSDSNKKSDADTKAKIDKVFGNKKGSK